MKDKHLEINYFADKDLFLIDSNLGKKRIDKFLLKAYFFFKQNSTISNSQLNQNLKFEDPNTYNLRIHYDSPKKSFRLFHDPGSDFFAYQLIREAIGNWSFKKDYSKNTKQ
jgi:hypothetical protein